MIGCSILFVSFFCPGATSSLVFNFMNLDGAAFGGSFSPLATFIAVGARMNINQMYLVKRCLIGFSIDFITHEATGRTYLLCLPF